MAGIGTKSQAPAYTGTQVLVDLRAAGEYRDVSVRTIYRLVEEGELESVHVGALHKITISSLEDFVDRKRERS